MNRHNNFLSKNSKQYDLFFDCHLFIKGHMINDKEKQLLMHESSWDWKHIEQKA